MKAHNQPPSARQPIVLSFDRKQAWSNRTPDVDTVFPSFDTINAWEGVNTALDFLDAIFQLEPLHSYRNASVKGSSDSVVMRESGLIDQMCPELSSALMSSQGMDIAPFLRENAEGCLMQSPDGILTSSSAPMLEYSVPQITAFTGDNGPEIAVIGERAILRETNEGPALYQRFPQTFVSVSPSLSNRNWVITDFALGRADITIGASV